MANITTQALAQLPDGEALLDFIARHRYAPENAALLQPATFALLPDYAQHVIHLLDFETEYEMQGLATLLGNSLGRQLPAIASSFEQTQNGEIATCLRQVVAALAAASGQSATEQGEASHPLPTWLRDNKVLLQQLDSLDERLRPLIMAKEYWDNALAFIRLRRGGPS